MKKVSNMTKQELTEKIAKLYVKWSAMGLNEYEKIELKKLEAQYKLLNI